MTETVVFPHHFRGPPTSANGGYAAGTVARALDGVAEVTLRRPPPLDTPLALTADGDRAELRDGDELVADAVTVTDLDLDVPEPVDVATAEAASLTSPMRDREVHPFPMCFTCGPDRAPGDGLRLFAGRVPGTDHFATVWTPDAVTDEIVWAALDCPSSAVIYLEDAPLSHVLGRIAARVHRVPVRGEPHVVTSWLRGLDGRKVFSASAIHGPDGTLCALARTTWIRLEPASG